MPQFVIVYVGGNEPASPEEGKAHFTKYMGWLASLGDAALSPMNPLKNTTTIKPDGSTSPGNTTKMSGYTIIEADSMDTALALAKDCPFLALGGSLEVSERVEMSG